jgi:hypothetical protein
LDQLLTIWNQSNNSIYLSISTRTHDKTAVLGNHHGGERISRVDLGAELGLFLFQDFTGDLRKLSLKKQIK